MQLSEMVRFLAENREVLITLILSLIAVIKLTAWGKAQAAALDTVVGVIEELGISTVKRAVSNAAGDLTAGAQDAISDSVAKADPKKKSPSLAIRVVRELLRGL